MKGDFWDYLQTLVEQSKIVIDRPRGSIHPRFIGNRYPVDYGYLEGTTSPDTGGIDIWIGTEGMKLVVRVLCTVDLGKKDTELKILYDCTDTEIGSITRFMNTKQMRAVYIKRSVGHN